MSLSLAAVTSFEHGPVLASAAGSSFVVLADDNGVTLVHDDLTRIYRGTVDDVAAGTHVYVLVDGQVIAHERDGTTAWETQLSPTLVDVTADPVGDTVVVRTADGRLIPLAPDGTRRDPGARTDQSVPSPNAPDEPTLAALNGRVTAANWTSYTVMGGGGGDLPAAVDVVGIVSDTVVTLLKDGRLLAHGDGERQWTISDVEWITPVGTDRIFCQTDGKLMTVTPAGDRAPVRGVAATGECVVSADGTTLCEISDETVRVFQPPGDPTAGLGLEVTPDSVVMPTDRLPVVVRNDDTAPVETAATIRGPGGASEEFSLSLSPGGRQRVNLAVEPAETETSSEGLTVTLLVGETTVDSVTVPTVSPSEMSAVDTEPIRTDGETVTLRVTVTNDSDRPIEGGWIRSTRLDTIPPAESASVDLAVAPGTRAVPATVESLESREITVDVPDELAAVSVSAGPRGFVEVSVSSAVSFPIEDTLTVSGLPTPDETLTRTIELSGNGTFVWTIPSTVGECRPIEAKTSADRDQGAFDPGVVEGVVRGDQRNRTAETATEPEPETATELETEQSESSTDDGTPIEISRHVETERPTVGRRESERVAIDNTGDESRTTEIESGGADPVSQTVSAGEQIEKGRAFVCYEDGSLPPVQVSTGDTAMTTDTVGVSPVEASIVPYVWWSDTGESHELVVAVNTDQPGQLVGVELGGERIGLEATLVPGEVAHATAELPPSIDAGVLPATVVFAELDDIDTLGQHLPERPSQSRFSGVKTTVTDGELVDGVGTIYVRVRNDSDRSIENLGVQSVGDSVTAGPHTEIGHLDPGESYDHRVRVNHDPTAAGEEGSADDGRPVDAGVRLVDDATDRRIDTVQIAETDGALTIADVQTNPVAEFPSVIAESF